MFSGKRILTIDDSSTIRNYLRRAFARLGASVDTADTGQAGVDKLSAGEPYDLALLDLILPDMSGLDALKQIRERNDSAAVVMLTGSGGVKSAIAAVQTGADGYIEKHEVASGDLSHFLYALEQALERRAGLAAQKQLQQLKADFYSMVTHDLRSPTGTILMATRMLLRDESAPLLPDQREMLDMVETSAEKLLRLINNYLDFAKIDAGYLRLDLQRTELRELVEGSARLARLQAQAKNQTLSLDVPAEPVPALADAERLSQVFDNLISNAIKYTPSAGHIRLQLRVDAARRQAAVSISDTGNGIPPDQIPALFAKYRRLPSRGARGAGGTGLGLLIVKEIVGAHDGTVHVESEGVPGKGTTLTVRLPLEQA